MAPGDTGIPVAKVGTIAMPLIGFYPPEREGAPPPPTTHYEVLLPSGRTGWVPVTAVRPLKTDHLCYARTPAGERLPLASRRPRARDRALAESQETTERWIGFWVGQSCQGGSNPTAVHLSKERNHASV